MRRISEPALPDMEVRKSARLKHFVHSESRPSPRRRPDRQWFAGERAADAGITTDYTDYVSAFLGASPGVEKIFSYFV